MTVSPQNLSSELGVVFPRILFPNKSKVDLKKWAVVACDQYTSEPEYWERVSKFVDGSPSTLRIIFPEVDLEKGKDEEIIASISDTMRQYESADIFNETAESGLVLVERTFRDGTMRRGIVVSLDLEFYDYKPNSQTIIRATEKTIESRIPPRLEVRKKVSVELPHIIVLIDDLTDSVISSVTSFIEQTQAVPEYDTDLMENSGHVTGWFVHDEAVLQTVGTELMKLKNQAEFESKYSLEPEGKFSPLVFAMGDGNHSLATAKAWWEQVKSTLDEKQRAVHPARFALVEIQNCQDPTLIFEPINRLVFTNNGQCVLSDFKKWLETQCNTPIFISEGEDEFADVANQSDSIGYFFNGKKGAIHLKNTKKLLPVATFTDFIDPWLANHDEAKIDYIHGTNALDKFCASGQTNIGFVFPSMAKSDLFKTVILEGVLPRKTFSMGSSHDKRFYFEGKRII